MGWPKANTNVALKEGMTALAFVIKDNLGNVIHLKTKLDYASSPLEAEFKALA